VQYNVYYHTMPDAREYRFIDTTPILRHACDDGSSLSSSCYYRPSMIKTTYVAKPRIFMCLTVYSNIYVLDCRFDEPTFPFTPAV
jgi:hypothetical protein